MSPSKPEWLWSSSVRRVMKELPIPFVLVDTLTLKELGSSPGDVMWNGSTLFIERECWEPWVVHEIAHWFIVEERYPERRGMKNWGGERGTRSEEDATVENEASELTVALLLALGLPWTKAADKLSFFWAYQDVYEGSRRMRKTHSEVQKALRKGLLIVKRLPWLQERMERHVIS